VSARQTGILLLEAENVHRFTKRERRLYTSLAGQVAVAVENQRLLAETRNVLAEVEATQRRYTIQAWETYRNANLAMNYEQTREGVPALGDDLPPEISQAIVQRKTVLATNGEKPKELVAGGEEAYRGSDEQPLPGQAQSGLAVPLTVRDEVIGVLGLQEIGQDREWSPQEIALVEAIAQQVAQAAENLRLIDETQQRAAREARVNEIGEKIQGAQSLEEALQIAVREVGLSLKAPQTAVQVEVSD
jgi:GAF domain-containing protein